MNKYGVEGTYEALRQKLLQYIKTIYLGKNKALRDVISDELEKPLCISQKPYIEGNQSYKVDLFGLNAIPDNILSKDMKKFYNRIISYNPYVHQVEAVKMFYSGKDLLVATGTGSGKTECFMWPIAGKLYKEALESPNTWKTRGVRAMMLYPMNALVSDQLGRLRKMLGDYGDYSFEAIFETTHGRRPQFGMYTGRTSYAGEQDLTEDKKFAKTLEKNLINCSDQAKEQLIEIGKYPAKKDLQKFVSKLKKGEHFTSPDDAEMLTRFEIQKCCPDILITNYSMLEYMLLRPRECEIWNSTKKWLHENEKNKLLFVIDEAHMYRGSSGGEVALLIRRLMHKLEIGRDKVQFILTTASVPNGKDEEVRNFANDLSAQVKGGTSFEIIRGTTEEISFNNTQDFSAELIQNINLDQFVGNLEAKVIALQEFAQILNIDTSMVDFKRESSVEQWIYSYLKSCAPALRMIKQCRGNATKLEELAAITFPNDNLVAAVKATSVLLAIVPLAKNKDGNVLFPARLHLMYRGLRGLFACTNPECFYKQKKDTNELTFGKVFLSKEKDTCNCGGKVYELYNDRNCGQLYLKGYIDIATSGVRYVWNERGITENRTLHEVHFYIIGKNETLRKDDIPKVQRTRLRFGFLDSFTGRLYETDGQAKNPNCLKVAYLIGEDKDFVWSFDTCPHCGKKNLRVTDFATKGNEPFFNLVSQQLAAQPPTLFTKEEVFHSPNRGRKVLLFSDSRQKAAILARDLTKAADEDAMKQGLTIAAKKLQLWCEENKKEPTMDVLYAIIVEIASKNGLRFFYGSDSEKFKEHIKLYEEEIQLCEDIGEEIDYVEFSKNLKPIPGLYTVQLLKQLCNIRSLSEIAYCWVEPSNRQIRLAMSKLQRAGISMNKEEYLKLFSAWVTEVLSNYYAYGVEGISDEERDNAAGWDGPKGIERGKEINSAFSKIVHKKIGLEDNQIDVLKECFISCTSEVDDRRYINPSQVVLKFGPYPEKEWYICKRCGRVSPSSIGGICIHCKKSEVRPMNDKDIEGLKFWRDPVEAALENTEKIVTGINAEEHTAQLSHKDQLDNMWSTTEDFEMRFQNVYVNEGLSTPIDVLSCTTTMEVGIDIGSLTAVGLRNIPPTRENYQQRAGRAGRRGSSVSSIVTYIDNGPHDSYYFEHPDSIISGQPRTPWIDNQNKKLVNRHLNIIVLNDYLLSKGLSMDTRRVDEFINNDLPSFFSYLMKKEFSQKEIISLVPTGLESCINEYKFILAEQLQHLKTSMKDFPEKYKDDNGLMISLLDALYLEGIMPTYSFPKDVVGFYIEDPEGKEIIEKPERSLDMAISEYAPGRILVVNKKTYKSGGIYSYHAKKAAGKWNNPANKYLKDTIGEYRKVLYFCINPACQWFSTEVPKDHKCPFCGDNQIISKSMVKPWGFAPLNGRSIKESEDKNERSYAELPSYAATPNDQMEPIENLKHVKIAKRADQTLLIVNKGIEGKGFIICTCCGAAMPSDDHNILNAEHVQRPYNTTISTKKCYHDNVISSYLGTDVHTDMVVFQFSLDHKKINTTLGNAWLKQAAVTLSEAMVLCAGRMLDVEFNEIKSGSRVREDKGKTYLDIFLFDSLSSGAGYSSAVADNAEELLKTTYEFLKDCTCEMTCHNCLNHFWNQRQQGLMNRHAAIDVLRWCMWDELAPAFTSEKVLMLAKPLKELFKTDSANNINICIDNDKVYALKGTKKKEIYFYPAMWSQEVEIIPWNSIAISDMDMKYALPKVYTTIIDEINKSGSSVQQTKIQQNKNRDIRISKISATDFSDETYSTIIEYVVDDIEESSEHKLFLDTFKKMHETKVYEKPFYNAKIKLVSNERKTEEIVWLLWNQSKVILLLEENDLIKETINNKSDWKCFNLKDLVNSEEFLKQIEV